MSESEKKMKMLRRWENARDNAKRASECNLFGESAFWTRISNRIERNYEKLFGTAFGLFVADYLA